MEEYAVVNGRGQLASLIANRGGLLRGLSYTYDGGNVLTQTITGQGLAAAVVQSFGYDGLNRLSV